MNPEYVDQYRQLESERDSLRSKTEGLSCYVTQLISERDYWKTRAIAAERSLARINSAFDENIGAYKP